MRAVQISRFRGPAEFVLLREARASVTIGKYRATAIATYPLAAIQEVATHIERGIKAFRALRLAEHRGATPNSRFGHQ